MGAWETFFFSDSFYNFVLVFEFQPSNIQKLIVIMVSSLCRVSAAIKHKKLIYFNTDLGFMKLPFIFDYVSITEHTKGFRLGHRKMTSFLEKLFCL